jgi:hypothetical protein
MISATDDMTRKVSGTALGPDLGMIGFLANTIHKRLPTIGTAAPRGEHTHTLARTRAIDAERALARLYGVVHLHHWP